MAYIKLTELGKQFIRNACAGTSNSLLTGQSHDKINDIESKLYNIDGHLPFCNPESPAMPWTGHAKFNGVNITTNQQLGEALIVWFDKYGQLFEMDTNIIAAQAFAESGYKIWNYPLTSNASGISQFTTDTTFGVIVANKFATKPEYRFTNEEIAAITKNLTGNLKEENSFSTKFLIGRTNRPFIHQNIIDNPEIMIKAQFCYMKYISNKCNGLASSALFGYNRGPNLPVTPSYTQSIQNAKNPKRGVDYEVEGIGYVYNIFNYLGNNKFSKYGYFGYDHLNLNEPFDVYAAEVAESGIYGVEVQSLGKYYPNGFKYPANYQLTKHLSYYDAISMNALMNPSQPERKNYDNTPTQESLDNLINIGKKIYDPLCDFIGKKVIVNSAYRGAYLNNVVKGSENSQHKLGEAIDIDAPASHSNSELFYYIANNLNFDQLIWEEGDGRSPNWIHVSLVIPSGDRVNRRKISLYNPSWAGSYRHATDITAFNTLKSQLYPTGFYA